MFSICLATLTASVFTLVYGYMVYPSLMSYLGGNFVKNEIPEKGSAPQRVSLIIPAHNEAAVIGDKISNSLAIEYPDLEIIVASDGSTDETADIAHGFPDVKVLAYDCNRGKTELVADAVAESSGQLLCLCDANVMFQPDAVLRLASFFEDDRVGGVTGDVRLQSEESSFGVAESSFYRMERKIQNAESRLGSVMGVDGGMYVIRRELYPKLEKDTILDDFSISMSVIRAGYKILYDHFAIAHENATEAASDEFRRRVRMGKGICQVMLRGYVPRLSQPLELFLFVSHKLTRWLSPWLLLLILFLAIVLSRYHWWFSIIPASATLLLLLAAIGAIWPNTRQLKFIVMPFYFVLSQLGFAWGMVAGLRPGSSGAWKRTSRKPLANRKVS